MYSKADYQKAWQAGRDAFRAGERRCSPFHNGSLSEVWYKGWDGAEARYQEKKDREILDRLP